MRKLLLAALAAVALAAPAAAKPEAELVLVTAAPVVGQPIVFDVVGPVSPAGSVEVPCAEGGPFFTIEAAEAGVIAAVEGRCKASLFRISGNGTVTQLDGFFFTVSPG